MKIIGVEYSLIPYGPAAGDRALIVEVSNEVSEAITKVREDLVEKKIPEKEIDATVSEATAKEMFADLKTLVGQDKVLSAQYDLALIAKTQFYFAGDPLVELGNAKATLMFFDMISVESLNRQKTSMHVTKLRPPFLGFIGHPINYSGANSLYESFNYLLITCGLEGITEEKINEYYRDFAMIEISRHQFCCFAFKISCPEDIEAFGKYYFDRGVIDIDPRRVYFIPATTDQETIDLVADFCLKSGYRYGLDFGLYSNGLAKKL